MLPTLAERSRVQQAKSRSRRPSRPPWPMPSEPPTALLFQVRPAVAEPEPPAPSEPDPALVAPAPAPARTALAEALLLLLLAVVLLIDGALALASLIDQAARRQRVPQPCSAPVATMALPLRGGSWALLTNP